MSNPTGKRVGRGYLSHDRLNILFYLHVSNPDVQPDRGMGRKDCLCEDETDIWLDGQVLRTTVILVSQRNNCMHYLQYWTDETLILNDRTLELHNTLTHATLVEPKMLGLCCSVPYVVAKFGCRWYNRDPSWVVVFVSCTAFRMQQRHDLFS